VVRNGLASPYLAPLQDPLRGTIDALSNGMQRASNTLTHDPLTGVMKRILIGTLVLIALIMLGIGITHAAENTPSIRVTKLAGDSS